MHVCLLKVLTKKKHRLSFFGITCVFLVGRIWILLLIHCFSAELGCHLPLLLAVRPPTFSGLLQTLCFSFAQQTCLSPRNLQWCCQSLGLKFCLVQSK